MKPAGAGGASGAGGAGDSEERTTSRREAGGHGMAMADDEAAAESFMWPVPIRVEEDWANERVVVREAMGCTHTKKFGDFDGFLP